MGTSTRTVSFLTIAFLFLLLLSFQMANSQGCLRAKGRSIINEKGENVLLRGMGLGGWMLQEGYMLRINKDGQQHRIRERIDSLIGPQKTGEFYEAWLANHTRKIDIDSMKAWGFNSVRLPMHYALYTLPVERESVPGKQTWLNKGFAMTDSLLQWCRENQMYLILDLHAAPGGQGNDLNISDGDTSKPSLWESEANREKTVALWRKIAERYVNEPWIGGYDIINEPNWGFSDPEGDRNGLKETDNSVLKKLLMDITKAIREVDQKHMVIIEGNGWGNNYNGILPTWDDNMVLSFHKYWNYNDQSSISQILKARDAYNIPVWLGETGENSNVWFTEAIRLLETNNIGWAWWPLKKMGFNNPLEIKTNHHYDQVVNYWNGRGPKPSSEIAWKGLQQLANNLKLELNIFHKDVIDAMMRQPFSEQALPFKKHALKNEITIQAVDYDLGKNRIAYFDHDTADYRVSGQPGVGNKGRVYRNDGVDIRMEAGKSNYFVSDIGKGEWLQYTIDVLEKGNYSVTFLLAGDSLNNRFSFWVNDKLSGDHLVNSSGSSGWQVKKIENIFLNVGRNVIRFKTEEGDLKLKSIKFKSFFKNFSGVSQRTQ